MCSPVQTSIHIFMFPKGVDVGNSSSHRGSGLTCHPLPPLLMGSRSQLSRGWAEGDSGTGTFPSLHFSCFIGVMILGGTLCLAFTLLCRCQALEKHAKIPGTQASSFTNKDNCLLCREYRLSCS